MYCSTNVVQQVQCWHAFPFDENAHVNGTLDFVPSFHVRIFFKKKVFVLVSSPFIFFRRNFSLPFAVAQLLKLFFDAPK
jgi:hypothetical protein